MSFKTLSNISVRAKLCHSMRSLLQGDSPAVVFTVIPRDSAISMNLLLANSPPLSVNNFSRAPSTKTHILNMLKLYLGLFGKNEDPYYQVL